MFLGVVIVLAVLIVILKIVENCNRTYDLEVKPSEISNPNYYLPYKVRQTIMSSHERLLFESLKTVLSFEYDVYPQVKLDKIFSVGRQRMYKYYLGYLRKINQKSVDFLVVKKNTQSPIMAIELDDSSHEDEDRRERDKFVEELCRRNNFPLIRFNPGQYKAEELKSILKKYLN